MTDPFEEHVARVGEPRPLDPEFRARLERTLADASASDTPVRWRIDRPRELPGVFRARLEERLTARRPRFPGVTRGIAAAIAVIVAAGTTLIVIDRAGAPGHGSALPRPVLGIPSTPPSLPAVRPPGSLRLFTSSGAFLRYVRGEALKLAGPYGIGDVSLYGGSFPRGGAFPVPGNAVGGAPASVPASRGLETKGRGSSFSSTNVQEEGVDEPDIVKTDGRRLVVLTGSDLRVLEVNHGTGRIRSTLKIENGVGLFLIGDKVIHFASLYQAPSEAIRATHAVNRQWTKVSVIDIAKLSSPKVVSSMSIEGFFVGARLARGVVRLIVQSGALGPAPTAFNGATQRSLAAAEAGNKRAIRRSFVGDWVPHYVVARSGRATVTGHVHDWSAVSRPPDRAGLSMLTLLTIDPDDPRPDNAASVIGAGEIIYSSLDNLYVTSSRLDDMLSIQRGRTPRAPVTRIHKFDIRDPVRAIYRASGAVQGFLLNQFSMSESAGYLRIATTLGSPMLAESQGASKSSVVVIQEKAGKLLPVGTLGNLGVGERIYSVRFLGTKAYVVTFRLLDPLFVIDLRIPTRPKLSGQLKVPGYSGYLHPVSDTLLLGVGRDADSKGAAKGLQLSLFDVSNPARPRRLDERVIGAIGSSEVETDHHSFLYWAPRRLAVVPATIYSEAQHSSTPFIGALALTISATSGLGEQVRLSHAGRTENGDPTIRRSLVIGNRLLTISDAGLLMSDLTTLAARTWVPFQA